VPHGRRFPYQFVFFFFIGVSEGVEVRRRWRYIGRREAEGGWEELR
jgi:hypothetical protein